MQCVGGLQHAEMPPGQWSDVYKQNHVWICCVYSVLLLLSIRDLIKSGKHGQVYCLVSASCSIAFRVYTTSYVVGRIMHANMEASCSGRCACTAPCHPNRILRSPAAHLQRRAPQALHEHNRCRQVKTHRSVAANRAKRKHRQCVTAAQTSGEVAEVQELHGVRIVADAQRRPQVQYLVVWKDGTPDTWQVPHSSVSASCMTQCQISAGLKCREPAQNLADNLLRDFEERWWSICRKVKHRSQRGGIRTICMQMHMIHQHLLAAMIHQQLPAGRQRGHAHYAQQGSQAFGHYS